MGGNCRSFSHERSLEQMHMNKNIAILGGHGDGLVVANAIADITDLDGSLEAVGFLNDHNDPGQQIGGLPVLEATRGWSNLADSTLFIAALHKVGAMAERIMLIGNLGIPSDRWTNVIHPSASIAEGVLLGHGNFIGQNAVLQPGVTLGDHCTVRAGANLGHDSVLDSFCYVGPNATLCGRAGMKLGAHLGPNAVVTDGIQMGRLSILAAGSMLARDSEEGGTYLGVPARLVRTMRNRLER